MGKIICDICGANYPETEKPCPICGTAKSEAAASAGDDGYAYVKGGRFSKSNVKKHNNNRELTRTTAEKPAKEPKQEKPAREKKEKAAPAAAQASRPAERERRRRQREDEPSNNVGLIIIAILLVIAVVVMCVMLVMKAIERQAPGNTETTTTGQVSSTDSSGSTVGTQGPVSIPCTELRLPVPECVFTNAGDTLQIDPIVQPENTTEKVLYISSDERIATVDENGIVTAVADGEAIIYVYCGSFKVELKVSCDVGVPPVETTNPTNPTDPTQPSEPPVILELNRADFTLNGYGATWNLYSGPIDRTEITWSSSDETVATVENGKVTAVGNGKATITAEYMDQKVTCIVRCANVEKPANTQYEVHTIYGRAVDITLRVGESLKLQLVDKETGLRVDASELTFTVAKEGYVTVDEEGRVKAVAPIAGGVYVYIEYEGVTYKCLVRVSAAE